MKLSIIVPTHERPDALRACLECIYIAVDSSPGFDYEVIVSDDGTRTRAQSMLGADFPLVRWIAGPRRGPAANRNAGAARASGEVIIFLDDDCLPTPGLLSAYANAFTNPALLAAEGRIRADRAQIRMDEEAPVNEHGDCFWSCNIALRREFFLTIGGFDERFPSAAMEDVELRERIKRFGTTIPFLPDALVIHPLRRTGGWKELHMRARGHGIYAIIPGCHLPPPSYLSAIWGTLRVLRRRFLPGFIELRGRGALRASVGILLPFLSTYEMKKALRAARSQNP
jgi:glycosyltransferase involved in cell wall biosynthesis